MTLTNGSEMFGREESVTLVRVADDLVVLDQPGGNRVWLCRPPRDPNFCDAP